MARAGLRETAQCDEKLKEKGEAVRCRSGRGSIKDEHAPHQAYNVGTTVKATDRQTPCTGGSRIDSADPLE
jgi:hypothetical protein